MPGTGPTWANTSGQDMYWVYSITAMPRTNMGKYIRPGHVLGLFYNNNARDGTHMGQYLYD